MPLFDPSPTSGRPAAALIRLGEAPKSWSGPLVGESSQTLYYFLQWESLAERERKWNAFQADPEWHARRADLCYHVTGRNWGS